VVRAVTVKPYYEFLEIVVYAAKFIADSSLPSILSPVEDSPLGKRPKGATDG
jgi:hypothetical protein